MGCATTRSSPSICVCLIARLLITSLIYLYLLRFHCTRFNCQCDEQLRHCLLNSNDEASFPVGLIYFNVAAITCYQQTPDCLNKDFR